MKTMKRSNYNRRTRNAEVEEKKVIRVAGYVRCSDEGQAISDFNTLDNQREIIARHIQTISMTHGNSWELSRFYEDSGYSGKNTDRPALEALLADVCAGQLDAVVVYKLDRITRSVADFYDLDRMFERYGVALVSVKEQFDTSTPIGRMMRNMALAFAQMERETNAERTRDKMYAEARRGRYLGGQIPYGYRLEDRKFVPDPEEAPAVRMMFEKYAETRSFAATRDFVNAFGFRTRVRTQKGRQTGGKFWTIQGIESILQKPRYKGVYTYGDIELEDQHEAIVSTDLWNLVNSVDSIRQRSSDVRVDHPYVLQGLVFCPHCGGRMTPYHVKHNDGRKRPKPYTAYYECMQKHKVPTMEKCPVGRYNAEKLERTLIKQIEKLSEDPEALKVVLEGVDLDEENEATRQRLSEVREALERIEPQIANLVDAVASGVSSSSVQQRLAEFERQQQALKAEEMILKADLSRCEQDTLEIGDVQLMLGQFITIYRQMGPEDQKQMMQRLVRRVEASDKKNVEVTLNALPPLSDADSCSSVSTDWLPGVDSNHEPAG